MNLSQPFAIISAELSDATAFGQRAATAELLGTLRALPYAFKSVVGVYKGTPEIAFLVVLPDNADGQRDALATLLRTARHHGQESILAVDRDRSARLIFPSYAPGDSAAYTEEAIGAWREVPTAEGLIASTFDPHTGKVYVAQ
jgi:hypothetical protein